MFFNFISRIVKKNFSLDSRSLALFRVLASFILIVDFLFTRLPYFTLFYTDKGVLPLNTLWNSRTFWSTTSSLNFISSSFGYQLALFILALVCFFMLFVGYKTRWVLFGSWVLIVSFHTRNFLIINSGDLLLPLLLFWSLYLPLNRHFSVDSALEDNKGENVFTFNSIFFIFQLLFVYYFTYLLKTDATWKTGEAVYYSLMLDNFRTVWGDILLQYEWLMRVISYVTYYLIEQLFPILFVLFGFWWRFRTFIILIMCVFHLSLGLFLHLGCFPWICMAGWLAFLPSEFWEKLKAFLPGKKKPLSVYYDGDCSFCKKSVALIKTFLILPHVSFAAAQSEEKALSEMEKRNSWLTFNDEVGWQSRWQAGVTLISYSPLFFYLKPLLRLRVISRVGDWFYGRVAKNRNKLNIFLPELKIKNPVRLKPVSILLSSFFFVCFIYALMWNIRTTNFDYYKKYMPKKWNEIGAFFHLHQYWNMFAPKPLDQTGWIILSAIQSEGDKEKEINLWKNGNPLSMEKPDRYDMTFPVFRFRKMFENFVLKYKKYSGNYLVYLCDKWNKKEGYNIKRIKFIYMKQKIPPPGEPLPEPTEVFIQKKRCR